MSGHSKPPVPIYARHFTTDYVDVSSKRRKLEHAIDAPKEVQCTTHVSVKREPSPSPPPSLALRSSGTIRIEIPYDCRKIQVGWKERRDKWVVQETLKLKGLGLKVPKAVVREDGLALDWVSLVPVCPLTLRPPNPVTPSDTVTQDVKPQQKNPDSKPRVDPLGHALRDQTASAYLSSTATPQPSVQTTKDNGNEVLPPIQGIHKGTLSDFVVVGAATRRPSEGPGSEAVTEHTPDHTVQREHRKLLPLELRPSTRWPSDKKSAKNRKLRRLAWITKEVEKVEAYTGEQVAGFRYDGDDVIIQLISRSSRAYRKRKQASHLASQPSQLDRAQPGISHTPSPRPNAKLVVGPSRNDSGECRARDPTHPLSQDSVNTAPVMIGGEAITVAGGVTVAGPSSHSTKTAATSNEATISTLGSPKQSTILNDGVIEDCRSASQGRGLGFLERYIQMFDSGRDALSLAYTSNATFSLTDDTGLGHEGSSGDILQIVKTGRSEIAKTLNKIRAELRHPPLAEIACSIASLDDMSPGGVLLTCNGALLPVDRPPHRQEHHSFFSRVFVLRQNQEDNRETWPLQIVAEQLTMMNKRRW